MNKRIFKIENSKGKSVGNHDSYSSLPRAKQAVRHCLRRLDNNSNIVEYEVSEVPSSKIHIGIAICPNPWGGTSNEFVGYKEFTNSSKEEAITFNK
jgi:hypothetical protein